MSSPLSRITVRLAPHLPGWIFLLAGISLIGMTVLTPPWLDCDQLRQQERVMRIQADCLARQELAYRRFCDALGSDDPVLLQRLAFHQLGLKPGGTEVLMTPTQRRASDPWPPVGAITVAHTATDGTHSQPHLPATASQTFESWLHTPLPRVGVNWATAVWVKSRLARLATGHSRLAMMGAGVLCLAGGLLWTGPNHR